MTPHKPLTATQSNVLKLLQKNISRASIADLVGVSRPRVSQISTQLRAMGYDVNAPVRRADTGTLPGQERNWFNALRRTAYRRKGTAVDVHPSDFFPLPEKCPLSGWEFDISTAGHILLNPEMGYQKGNVLAVHADVAELFKDLTPTELASLAVRTLKKAKAFETDNADALALKRSSTPIELD